MIIFVISRQRFITIKVVISGKKADAIFFIKYKKEGGVQCDTQINIYEEDK